MAVRVFGAVYCSIWEDDDFIRLSAAAQRTYLFLTTQPEIEACGSLALTLRRWSGKCSDDADGLAGWLAELVDAGFVQIDEDEEELLVRTFAKHDRGYKHAVRVKAVIKSARAIRSTLLRSTAVDELGKLGLSIDTPVPPQSHTSATTEGVESQRFLVPTLGDQGLEPGTGNLERGTRAADASPPLDDDPDSPFCAPHQPAGPDGKPCTSCADRAKAIKHKAARAALATAEAKADRRTAIDHCTRCNPEGFIEGPDGELLGQCSHSKPPLAAVPDPTPRTGVA